MEGGLSCLSFPPLPPPPPAVLRRLRVVLEDTVLRVELPPTGTQPGAALELRLPRWDLGGGRSQGLGGGHWTPPRWVGGGARGPGLGKQGDPGVWRACWGELVDEGGSQVSRGRVRMGTQRSAPLPPPPRVEYQDEGGLDAGPPAVLHKGLRLCDLRLFCQELPPRWPLVSDPPPADTHPPPPVCHVSPQCCVSPPSVSTQCVSVTVISCP